MLIVSKSFNRVNIICFADLKLEKRISGFIIGTGMNFAQKVIKAVKNIKKGETSSYKEVAAVAGRPKAYWAVGNILNKNCDPTVPCHRVIRSDGKIGGYNRGTAQKIKLLKKEGAI